MRKLVLAPEQDNYSVEFADNVRSVRLDGGKSKYRLNVLGGTSRVSVSWNVNREGYDYISSFYRLWERNPSQGFLIDLYMGESFLTEHTAYFVAGSYALDGQEGLSFSVSATLEVLPLPYAQETDESQLDVYEAYGDDASDLLGLLERVVNYQLPSV